MNRRLFTCWFVSIRRTRRNIQDRHRASSAATCSWPARYAIMIDKIINGKSWKTDWRYRGSPPTSYRAWVKISVSLAICVLIGAILAQIKSEGLAEQMYTVSSDGVIGRTLAVNELFPHPNRTHKERQEYHERAELWPQYPTYSLPGKTVEKCSFPMPVLAPGFNSLSKCTTDFIRHLNSFNLTYHIDFGTALGAYRHGGPLPMDKDLDVVFYAYNNEHVSGDLSEHFCDDVRGNNLDNPIIGTYTKRASQWTMCNKGHRWWMDNWAYPMLKKNLAAYMEDKYTFRIGALENFGNTPTRIEARYKCPNRLQTLLPLHLDFDSALYHPRGRHVCACRFGDVYALCAQDTGKLLKSYYGDEFMTPSRVMSESWEFG